MATPVHYTTIQFDQTNYLYVVQPEKVAGKYLVSHCIITQGFVTQRAEIMLDSAAETWKVKETR
jgi:hypothetical protein